MDEERKRYLFEAVREAVRRRLHLLGTAPPTDDASDPGEPDALVGAPIKPRPNLDSGTIALPEPDPEESDH